MEAAQAIIKAIEWVTCADTRFMPLHFDVIVLLHSQNSWGTIYLFIYLGVSLSFPLCVTIQNPLGLFMRDNPSCLPLPKSCQLRKELRATSHRSHLKAILWPERPLRARQ